MPDCLLHASLRFQERTQIVADFRIARFQALGLAVGSLRNVFQPGRILGKRQCRQNVAGFGRPRGRFGQTVQRKLQVSRLIGQGAAQMQGIGVARRRFQNTPDHPFGIREFALLLMGECRVQNRLDLWGAVLLLPFGVRAPLLTVQGHDTPSVFSERCVRPNLRRTRPIRPS